MIEVQGNKGGDYLKIEPRGGNLVYVEVGHCCVVTVKQEMPVEILTAVLTQWEEIELPWSDTLNDSLLKQVSTTEG